MKPETATKMKAIVTIIAVGFILSGIAAPTNPMIITSFVAKAEYSYRAKGDTNPPTVITKTLPVRVYQLSVNFFSNLKKQIAPKDGETDVDLLMRFLRNEHGIVLAPPGGMFLNVKTCKLLVRAEPDERDKIESLICQISDSK